ncbi:MAG: quinate 5-dehydrogenase [Bacillota bacterium]
MKKIISVSLGSSTRNHQAEVEFLGEMFHLERIGTNGDFKKALDLIAELDGKVDCITLGGIDRYFLIGSRRYEVKDARKLALMAKKTPVVDGSGLKNTLERKVVDYMQEELQMDLRGRKVLMVSAVDRFGMAEGFTRAGCRMNFADLIFALHIPMEIHTLRGLIFLARVLLPIVTRLPFQILYPTGSKQEVIKTSYARYYQNADIIAGDFLFIKRYLPEKLEGKTVVTNTITRDDMELLRSRGVRTLITSTPELKGRSFGTNVMEGLVLVLTGKSLSEVTEADYETVFRRLDLKPRVAQLNQ